MRYNKVRTNLKVTQAPSVTLRVPPSLPQAMLTLGGRLLCVVPQRIVGSGFCPTARGHPRAMLAPDASVGKAEIQLKVEFTQ